ncbi:hypothetical protein DPX16_1539 [Anabarilius grahami]|uniref:Uncharacterized protein n=1 Tax=Anabarilius grahami TaxID=495550 RepID=A0A3N0XSK5_ANAGA|nr:hypothetical protein DPX16_1539 [Anabarilius grahami]
MQIRLILPVDEGRGGAYPQWMDRANLVVVGRMKGNVSIINCKYILEYFLENPKEVLWGERAAQQRGTQHQQLTAENCKSVKLSSRGFEPTNLELVKPLTLNHTAVSDASLEFRAGLSCSEKQSL